MRHQNKIKKLGRTAAHRKATFAALSSALIEHKKIETTLPKAKALRSYVEPLINRAKEDTTQNRRQVFRRLQSKEAVKELFGDIASNIGDRPGGYTRIVKLGLRQGDGAEMALIELVDYNDVRPDGASSGKKKTRRGGGGGRRKKSSGAAAVTDTPPAASDASGETVAEAPETDAVETPETDAPAAEDASTQSDDAPETPSDTQTEHPDTPQGAAPQTGDPAPETGKGDQGTSGGTQHRG